MPTSRSATPTSESIPGSRSGPSRGRAWLVACRPKTLAAGAVPVVVGSAIAIDHGVFALLPAAAALIGALLIQVGTNLANDYYDHVKGADTPDRLGRARASATGAIEPHVVRNAAFAAFAASAVVGLYLIWIAGWPVLVMGAAGVVAGILYTAGPKPMGYIGLGDLLVFVFFGPVAVAGTYYVQALEWDIEAALAGAAIGALATSILIVNNLRDIETDRRAGKKTLAVLIGVTASRIEYIVLIVFAYGALVMAAFGRRPDDYLILLPLVLLPEAVGLLIVRLYRATDGEAYNRLLELTSGHLALFGLFASIGWVL